MKNKLAIFDMDGTLFDTKDVNYHAYLKALQKFNFNINYDYYCSECNGRLYKQFLPTIIGENNNKIMEKIHAIKKESYGEFLDKAIVNNHLFEILNLIKEKYYIALVTTASKQNTLDILKKFNKTDCFDLILTHDDIINPKPNPEGFIKAMDYFNIKSDNCIIFEDSKPGIEAAINSGGSVFVVKGFN